MVLGGTGGYWGYRGVLGSKWGEGVLWVQQGNGGYCRVMGLLQESGRYFRVLQSTVEYCWVLWVLEGTKMYYRGTTRY